MYKILQEEPEQIDFEDVVLENLQAVLSKCLAKKAEDRYPDFKKIIVDLNILLGNIQTSGVSVTDRDLLATIPIKTQKKDTTQPAARKSNRFPLIVAGLVVVLALTGFWFWKVRLLMF